MLCAAHRRDAAGNVVVCADAAFAAFAGLVGKAEKLAISRPENDAVFCLVRGAMDQRIVCQVVGNPAGAKLWWFVDGRPAGESVGLQPMTLPMEVGQHEISCSTAEGVSSSVRVKVVEK